MTVARQVTTAVHLAEKHKLKNVHVCVRFNDEVRKEFDTRPLSESDLRGLEVWITQGNGYIYGIVGDREEGPKNVTISMPYSPEEVDAQGGL